MFFFAITLDIGENKISSVLPTSPWSVGLGCQGRQDVAGLVLRQVAIVLKHDSAFSSYFFHPSHLAVAEDECLGEVDCTFRRCTSSQGYTLPQMNI